MYWYILIGLFVTLGVNMECKVNNKDLTRWMNMSIVVLAWPITLIIVLWDYFKH